MTAVIITDPIFELFPDFTRGLVVVTDLSNQKSYKRVRKLLRAAIEARAGVELDGDERLLAWDEAHRKFGSDPARFPPSVRSLVHRIREEPNVPFINTVVALFNTISLKYLLPCGGDDIDRVSGNLVLGRATGDESFTPLGGEGNQAPEPGEVIYYDDASGSVLCRRWNWRNGDRTKIEVESKRLVINIDGLPPITSEEVRAARDELADALREHCQAELSCHQLDRQTPRLDLQGSIR